MTTEDRPIRPCDVCGISDDHPRHVHDLGPVNQLRHMDCCREAGCPDGSCDQLVAAGAEDLRGPALVEYLMRSQ